MSIIKKTKARSEDQKNKGERPKPKAECKLRKQRQRIKNKGERLNSLQLTQKNKGERKKQRQPQQKNKGKHRKTKAAKLPLGAMVMDDAENSPFPWSMRKVVLGTWAPLGCGNTRFDVTLENRQCGYENWSPVQPRHDAGELISTISMAALLTAR